MDFFFNITTEFESLWLKTEPDYKGFFDIFNVWDFWSHAVFTFNIFVKIFRLIKFIAPFLPALLIAFSYFGPLIKITNPQPTQTGEDSVYALQIGACTYALKFLSSKNLERIFDFFHYCYKLFEKVEVFTYNNILSHIFYFISKHTTIYATELCEYLVIFFGVFFERVQIGNILFLNL
jgi:hypothetical protein